MSKQASGLGEMRAPAFKIERVVGELSAVRQRWRESIHHLWFGLRRSRGRLGRADGQEKYFGCSNDACRHCAYRPVTRPVVIGRTHVKAMDVFSSACAALEPWRSGRAPAVIGCSLFVYLLMRDTERHSALDAGV